MALNDNQKKKKVLLEDLETFHDGMIKELNDKGVYYMPVNGIPTTDLSNGAVSIAKTKRKTIDLTAIPTILEGSRLDLDDSDIINMFQGVTDASSLYSNYVAQNDSFLEVSSDTSTQLTNCVSWGDENNFGLNFNCVLDGMTLFLQVEYRNNTLGGYIESSVKKALKEITYNDLVSLKTQNKLVPGTLYRITDYITTTAADYTQSAGHAFDVVVLALDSSTLDCKAMAIQHDGDTYFNSADLSKWELKYDINNDTTKYTWADATNGKGVIYWMRDEHGNECNYDFKNIMFKKYKIKSVNDIHLSTNASPLATKIYNQIVADLSASYTDDNEVYAMWYIPHSGIALYVSSSDFSSFSYTDWTPDANAKYIEIMFASTQKGYIVAEVVDDGFFYTFDNYNTTTSAHEDYSLSRNVANIVIGNKNKKNLPFINFIGKNNTRSFSAATIKKCRYSVFGYSLNRMYIDEAQWICGIGINGMRGSYFARVIIGTIIRVNNTPQTVNSICVYFLSYAYIMGNNNYLTGGYISYVHFGYNCYYNDIRQGTYILLGQNCSQNTFGENCENINLGNECCRNTFGNHARYITGGNKIQDGVFGPECNNIIIGQDANNLQDYVQAIEVDATTCYVNIYSTTATSSTTYLKGIVVKNSASGTSTTPKDISTTAGNSYITTFRGANDTDIVV